MSDPLYQFNSLVKSAGELTDLGKHSEAVKLYQDAWALKPKNALVNAALGLSLLAVGATEPAIGYLKTAVTLDPASAKYRVNLCTVYMDKGRFKDALAVAAEALSSTTQWTEDQLNSLWKTRGLVEAKLDMPQPALVSFLNALKHSGAQGPNADLLHNCARLLLKTNQAGEAVPLFERLVELEPENPENSCNLGIALTSSRKFNEALTILDASLKKWPNDASLWLQHGIALRGVQRLTRAAGSFSKAAEMDKQNEMAWLMKGLTLGT